MNWQDKLAILKMAGYEVTEVEAHKTEPDGYYKWVIESGKGTAEYFYEADDDLKHIVCEAWHDYEDKQNEKAS